MNLALIRLRRRLLRLASLMLICGLCSNLSTSRGPNALESVRMRGYLQVITFTGPLTYYEDNQTTSGFEYLLAKAFANYLGVELRVSLIDDLGTIFTALGGPRGDFAAAGLTITEPRRALARFTRPYAEVQQVLLYRLGEKRPRSLKDTLGGRLLVVADSAHVEFLEKQRQDVPGLDWEAIAGAEMLELMQLVHDGMADYAIVDSSVLAANRGLYERARKAIELTSSEHLAWAFPRGFDSSLRGSANAFLDNYQSSGQLSALNEQFFGARGNLSVGGSQTFRKRIEQRLPQYLELIKTTAQEFKLDWKLLAAIAYQESHWDPDAVSPTGVRGLMMLTRSTAKELGVKNRRDPKQSLNGGAEYFLRSKAKIPADIPEPDRTWMGLAAYNVGYGHLEDARVLTERHGDDPHLWEHVRKYLPLLQQKKYYRTVRHGFARGREPVQYVRNIRHYRAILQWHDIEQQRLASRQSNTKQQQTSDQDQWLLPTAFPLSL